MIAHTHTNACTPAYLIVPSYCSVLLLHTPPHASLIHTSLCKGKCWLTVSDVHEHISGRAHLLKAKAGSFNPLCVYQCTAYGENKLILRNHLLHSSSPIGHCYSNSIITSQIHKPHDVKLTAIHTTFRSTGYECSYMSKHCVRGISGL